MKATLSVVIAIVSALALSGIEAKPRETPAEKSPAQELLEEAHALSLKGDFDGAYQKLDLALQADPHFWQAIYYRAELHFDQHRYETALQDCSEILRLKPDQAAASLLQAQTNSKLGRNEECMRELEQVISHSSKKDPRPLVQAYEMRAWLRATSRDANFRDGKQALSDAKEACKLSHDSDPMSLDTLAAAYAEVGEFAAAVDAEDRAIKAQLVSDEFNIPTENLFQKHRALFQKHQSIREE